jgi:hypothetical protein
MYVCARAVSRTLALSLALSRITPNQLKMHKKLQKMQNTCALIHNNALYIYIYPLHPPHQLKMHKKLQIERCVCARALCLLLALCFALHCMHACCLAGLPRPPLHQLRTAMHHHPPNQERAFNLSILPVSGPGVRFPVLSQIKSQAPLLVVPFRQFL